MLLFLMTLFIPLSEWTTETIDELRIRGELPLVFTTIKPYEYAVIKRYLKNVDVSKLTTTRKLLVTRLSMYYGGYSRPIFNLKVNTISDTTRSYFVWGGINYPSHNLGVDISLIAKFGKSNAFPVKTWHYPHGDTVVGIDLYRAYVSGRNGNLRVTVGRLPVRWGYGLLVSGSTIPYDLILLRYMRGAFSFVYLFAPLDQYVSADSLTPLLNRYFCAHRLDIALLEHKLILSLSEGILFARQDAMSALYYLNPVAIYRLAEYNAHYARKASGAYWFNDDLYWEVGITLYLKDTKLYFEWLLDDVGFVTDPYHPFIDDVLGAGPFAYILGVKRADILVDRTLWWLEYLRVNAYCYWHALPQNYFVCMGYPLAHRLGSDFDITSLTVVYHHSVWLDIKLSISFTRKGQTHLAMDELRPPRNCFLLGVPQKTLKLHIGGETFHIPWFVGGIDLSYSKIWNYGNKLGNDRSFWEASFYGEFRTGFTPYD